MFRNLKRCIYGCNLTLDFVMFISFGERSDKTSVVGMSKLTVQTSLPLCNCFNFIWYFIVSVTTMALWSVHICFWRLVSRLPVLDC